MTVFFSTIFYVLASFEACVVVLMLLAIFMPVRSSLLPLFLDNLKGMTKFSVLKQWAMSTACVVAVWWLSGLSTDWLLVSFGLDVISVPATLWLIEISRYNPAESETLAG